MKTIDDNWDSLNTSVLQPSAAICACGVNAAWLNGEMTTATERFDTVHDSIEQMAIQNDERSDDASGMYARIRGRWNTAGSDPPYEPYGLSRQVKTALLYPLSSDLQSFLRGSVLLFSTIFLLPLPLLWGYLLKVGADASEGKPASGFAEWKYQYLRGIVLLFLITVFLFVSVFVGALLGLDEAGAVLLLGWLLYATPGVIGVYAGSDELISFDVTKYGRWLVTRHYVATVLVLWTLLFAGYIVTYLGVFTVIGWIFLGFYAVIVSNAFLGFRYGDVDLTAESTPTESDQQTSGVDGDTDPSTAVGGTDKAVSSVETVDVPGSDVQTEQTPDGMTASDEREESIPDRSPGVYWDNGVGTDTLIRTHEGELVTDNGVTDIQISSLTPNCDDRVRDRFVSSVRAWRGISHNPQIVTVEEVGDDPIPFVAYDPSGCSLSDILPTLSGSERISIVIDIAEALRLGRLYNHNHGNLTPSCVQIESGDVTTAAVGRWGIAREVHEAATDEVLITPYTAPEQVVSDGGIDEHVDVYQIGALACYVLTGCPPVTTGNGSLADAIAAGDHSSIVGDDRVPDDVASIVERALSTDPEERFDSASVVKRALQNAR